MGMFSGIFKALGVFLVVAVIGGVIAAIVGSLLARKYKDHPNENTIVTVGFVVSSAVSLAAIYLICKWLS